MLTFLLCLGILAPPCSGADLSRGEDDRRSGRDRGRSRWPAGRRHIAIEGALASAISITELLKAGLSQKALLANPSPLIFVAVVYLMLFVPLTQFAGFLERKMKRSQRQLRL